MQRMTHEERRKRHKAIAEDAKTMDLWAICQKYDVSVSTVRAAAAVEGVPYPSYPRSERASFKKAFQILFRLMNGEPQASISRTLGVSRQFVHQLKDYAIECGFVIPSHGETKR